MVSRMLSKQRLKLVSFVQLSRPSFEARKAAQCRVRMANVVGWPCPF